MITRLPLSLLVSMSMVSCSRDYHVQVSGGEVPVSADFWKPMSNPEPFAENFVARAKRIGDAFEQVVTVFKGPMRSDQASGIKLAPDTWCEFMVIHPGNVTLQIRQDHGVYWVLSRQTLAARAGLTLDLSRYRPFLTDHETQALQVAYSDEIDRTQSLLAAMGRR